MMLYEQVFVHVSLNLVNVTSHGIPPVVPTHHWLVHDSTGLFAEMARSAVFP